MKKTVIHGGLVATSNSINKYDILIVGEKISALGYQGAFSDTSVDKYIDATDLIVMPGLIDPHVHFDAPFMGGSTDHDLLSGTKACAYGGITSVISFSNQPKGASLVDNVREWDIKNINKAYIDWSMHSLIYDASDETLNEIPKLIEVGVPTYKCFTTYRHSERLMDDDSMLLVLQKTAESGGMLMVHCEHDATCEYLTQKAVSEQNYEWIYHAKTRPARAEDIAIQRVIDLMKTATARVYIVHASTENSTHIISKAQAEGLPVKAETCTHYLMLTEDKLLTEEGFLYICSPPLRRKRDLASLWNAIKYGPLDIVSSDDAGLPSKMREELANGRFDQVPSGMPGVEPRLTLLYTEGVLQNRIDWIRLVELTSTNPAKIFGLRQKGRIEPGADADILLFDPNIEWILSSSSLHMNTDFCPFEGRKVFGKAKTVLCRGEDVLRDYELVGTPNHGRRVFRKL